jgi:type I restriction enzyme S subunit
MEIKHGYKQTEVGIIPEDWSIDYIENLAQITTGGKNTQDRVEQGQYPFFVRSQVVERINSYSFAGEAVLTAGDGVGTGKVFHYIKGKFDVHQRVYRISDFSDSLNGYFFYLYFSTHFYNRIMQMTAKSSVDSVRREMIARMPLPLPPTVAEQRAIAEALSDVDASLGGLDRLIAKKRDLNQAAMQHLLTGLTRLPGFQGKWEIKRLGKISSIKDGTHQTPKYVSSGIPFYSVEQVTSGDFKNTKFISEKEHRFLTRTFKIEEGDILMTRIGSIGDCKLIDWKVEASFYVSLALLKINSGSSASFVTQYSNTTAFKKEVERHSLPSAIPKKINLGPISQLKIELPPTLEEQTAIAEVLSDMDAEIAALEQRREKTLALKQAMMQELLTGKTRLI